MKAGVADWQECVDVLALNDGAHRSVAIDPRVRESEHNLRAGDAGPASLPW